MLLKLLSRLFKSKLKKDDPLHTEGEGSDNAKAKKEKEIITNPQKTKAMKKAKPSLPASSQLIPPASSGKGMVKKAVAKKVAKALVKKAAKKKK